VRAGGRGARPSPSPSPNATAPSTATAAAAAAAADAASIEGCESAGDSSGIGRRGRGGRGRDHDGRRRLQRDPRDAPAPGRRCSRRPRGGGRGEAAIGRAVVDAERVDVDALAEDDGALCAEGLLEIEVGAGDAALEGLAGVAGGYGLEAGGIGGLLGRAQRWWGLVLSGGKERQDDDGGGACARGYPD
jgi:hypothetical protein